MRCKDTTFFLEDNISSPSSEGPWSIVSFETVEIFIVFSKKMHIYLVYV